ncbi:MAG: acetate/propionate family kinase, partial [Thermosynechococcaceae cyanobacterium]
GGVIYCIGQDAVLYKQEGQQSVQPQSISAPNYGAATKAALGWLTDHAPADQPLTQIDAVGHRVVHGGETFTATTQMDESAISEIEALTPLAPLHNPPALAVIRASRDGFGAETPMVAVFDTVFHQTMPDRAKLYGLPWQLAERHQIRRYGFHGISHQYIARRYAELTQTPWDAVNIITLHLEGGCSATAIKEGQVIDTSMGFTPLEGLMMGTRCGDLDPALVGYLARQEDISLEDVEELLNRQSGLLGLSGVSHDTRDLLKKYDQSLRVRQAFDVFCYRILKYIGAYQAAMGGADAIVFGGGIGENTILVREQVCQGLAWCSLQLDGTRNQSVIDCEGQISTDDSRLHAYVIPTNEALEIAFEAAYCIKAGQS